MMSRAFVTKSLRGAVAAATMIAASMMAQNAHTTAQPQARVMARVDATKTVTLAHTMPAAVANAQVGGRLDGGTDLGQMYLVLKSTDAQELALRTLVDAQQDKGSANYHQWMTPETFANAFGVAKSDIAKVTAWMGDSGLQVDKVSLGGRFVAFHGTAAQVEAAFHTEMHTMTLNGVTRVSNTVDLSVPEALAPVVVGVASLNSFGVKANAVNPRKMVIGNDGEMHNVLPGSSAPDYTSLSSGNHFVGPGDFATIYNTKPLIAAGIDGRGVKIGIIGRSAITLADVQAFRSLFQLQPNDPTFTNIGNTPAVNGDDVESDLDVEWAAGVATAASVNFVTSSGSLVGSGIDTAGLYLVDNNNADIISLSYGGCEVGNGASGTAYWNTLWEQAAAQGQTVFISTGDSGAGGCDSSSATFSSRGYGVNALGSSAYNVAVGGSEFNEGNAQGVTPYWGAGGVAPYGTALSYIPEQAWNEGKANGGSGVFAGGGGVSIYTALPAFQVAPGVPTVDPIVVGGPITGQHRYVPDLSLIATGGHDGTIICYEGSCKFTTTGAVAGIGAVGGTSVATPVMASVQALINQKNGGRQGNANYYYYKLAAAQSAAACNSTTGPATTCVFNDITVGGNTVPSNAAGTTFIGFNAGVGFDLATGLGTPNVTNMANAWKNVTFNATTTALTLTPTTSLTHGVVHNFAITVTPASGTAKPTGDVSIIATSAMGGGNVYTLAAGTVSGTITSLPGGTYAVHAHYAGDTTFGASDSPNVTITVAPEASTTATATYLVTSAGNVIPATTFGYGQGPYVDVEVTGASFTGYNPVGQPNTGTPTGTITYTFTKGGVAATPVVLTLDTYADSYLVAAAPFPGFYIIQNYPTLLPGVYTLTTAYSGDASFNASSATNTVTINKITTTGTARAVSADILPGATATINYSQATVTSGQPAIASGVPPTGTVTFTDTTTSTVLGTGTLTTYTPTPTTPVGAVAFTTNAITTLGAHLISATYSGDSNYNAFTIVTPVTVNVTAGVPTVTVLTPTTSPFQVGKTVTLTAAVTPIDTGVVSFYDSGLLLGQANVSGTTGVAGVTFARLTAGVHTLTAVYGGSALSLSSTSVAVPITVLQNTPVISFSADQTNLPNKPVTMQALLGPSPVNALPTVPAPTGVITFMDGTTVLGTAAMNYQANTGAYLAAFTVPAGFAVGSHSLTAVYAGDANYAGVTSLASVSNIAKFPTATSLATSATTIGTGVNFTLTSTVVPNPANTLPLSGTVTFFDGAATLGTSTLSAAGVATLTVNVAATGAHAITATYNGDANYAVSSTTGAVVVTAVTPSFSISVAPTALTITRGVVPTPPVVTITPVGNYNGTAVFGCTGLPVYASCIFTPLSVAMTGNNAVQTATVQVFTLGAPSYAGFLWIPAGLLAGFVGLRRKQLSARGRQVLVLMVMACSLMAMSGCSTDKPYTPTGSFTMTINAVGTGTAGTSSPNVTPTATVALTIQ